MPCRSWGGPVSSLSLIMWPGNKISRKPSQLRRSVIQEWRTARQMSGREAAVGEKKQDQRVRAARRVAQFTFVALCIWFFSGSSLWLIDGLWSCRRRATAAFSWLCFVFFKHLYGIFSVWQISWRSVFPPPPFIANLLASLLIERRRLCFKMVTLS